MPATTATAVPFPSDFAFSAISVLASSISSRTSSDAFAETSPTTSPSDLSAPWPLSVIAAPHRAYHLREHDPAHEGRDNGDFGVADRVARLVRVPRALGLAVARGGGRGFRRVVARFHQSGGSSSKTFTQITVAMRVVAIVASAPRPASSPLHMSRFASSFCISAGTLTGDCRRATARRLEPATDRFHDQRLRLLEVGPALRD